MFLITLIEHSLALARKEHVWINQHMIGINAEVMAACANITRQFNKLLEQPSTAIKSAGRNEIE